jgi:2-polyprenyl-6-methoxyphenol hydroxylase-like FAD-dependent oxidoreductase
MEKQTNVLIVGGGIAGLTVAFLLEQQGYNTEIVERAAEWKPCGGGITLMLNGMKMLHELGVGEQVEAKGQAIRQVKITDAHNHLLSCFNVEQYATTVAKTVTIHRTDLHEILKNKLTTTQVYFNTTMNCIEEQAEKVKVIFSDGRICFYDLVVGCDGMYSDVRKLLFKSTQLKYAGYACWRFVCNMDDYSYEEDTLTEMWGEGKRFGIVPLTGKRVHCFASVNTSTPETLKTFSVEQFKFLFSDFKGTVPQLLHQLTDNNKFMFNRLEDVHVKNWANGRVVLIGDAAHGMTPNLTQGASMAMKMQFVYATG